MQEPNKYSLHNMGFLHQFCLLLWKNLTLKKRSPFVLLFELFIPLVLFVILLSIRKREFPRPKDTYYWYTQTLPSAGAIPIMQSFCEENNQKHNDSDSHPIDESATEFLQRLQSLALQNNFFYPGYTPREMEQLPKIYKNIIEVPTSMQHSLENASDFQFESLFSSSDQLQSFLKNISVPQQDIDALLHTTVNVHEIYSLIFGSYPPVLNYIRLHRSVDDYHPVLKDVLQSPKSEVDYATFNHSRIVPALLLEIVSHLETSISNSLVNHSALWEDKRYTELLFSMQSGDSAIPQTLSPEKIAQLLKLLLLSPEVLHTYACDSVEFLKVLTPQTSYNISDLAEAQIYVCNMTEKQFIELSEILNAAISEKNIISLINLQPVDLSSFLSKIEEFLVNAEKFYRFQKYLLDISVMVASLPQDGCDVMYGDNLTIVAPESATISNKPAAPKGDVIRAKKVNTYAGFLKFWDGMQKTICGHTSPDRNPASPEPKSNSHANFAGDNEKDVHSKGNVHKTKRSAKHNDNEMEDFKIEELGLNDGQKKNLRLLLHVLYSNPKVLYAPNNTHVNTIIKKANETFKLVDSVNEYAREWLNISTDLKAYLLQNSTKQNIQDIRWIQRSLRQHSTYLSMLSQEPRMKQFLNLTVPDADLLLHEIDSIDNAACTWLTLLSGINLNVYQGFASEQELVNFFLMKQYHENVSAIAGVVFENIEANKTFPQHIRYKIRQNATFTPTTKRVRDKYWFPGPGSGEYPYYSFGFVWIQDVIDRAIINVQVGRDVVEPGSYLIRFPYPCWIYDQFVFMIEHVMPLCLTISWVYSVAMLVQSIVYEKEQRLKEVMKMMGLSNAVHWLAWFMTTFIQFTVTMIVLTAMLKYGRVLTYSNIFVVFTTLELFAIATISFCFLISTLYSKAKVAAACAGIIYFLTYVPYMYVAIKEDVAGDNISSVVKTLVSLFSTTAFGLGGKYFAFYEETGVGVQWNNINTSPVEGDQFNLFMVHLMMVFDAFLYSILAWYIENVYPGSYGLPKPWYFPFTRTYWCGSSHKMADADCCCMFQGHPGYSLMEEDQAGAMARDADCTLKFEPEPTHLTQGVCIDNLTKVYKTGKKLAVKNLNLNLYEGQITSFLGHNGAGKTTTMSILSGLFPPTSGSATIYGHDIRMDMEIIRQGLGMCPQHNVLFDKLTVEEHLWFYSRLKGMKTSDIKAEMEMMIEDLGLPKKRHSRVDCLSGGMQRKLSVAIAFVGGSRTVILDEPTAGIDPYARRAIWDLLIKYKNGRTILLSTHHMDEADVLGDRIAIISNGEMKCCGSSLFLKNTFCEGYHLYLVKKESEEDTRSLDDIDSVPQCSPGLMTHCQTSAVTQFIQNHVSTAYLKADTRRELHYILPYEEAKKGNFEKLFQAFESTEKELHISSFGVADSTLEEVFLEVTENAIKEEEDKEANQPKPVTSTNSQALPNTDLDPLPTGSALDILLAEAACGPMEANKSASHWDTTELELGHMSENRNKTEEVIPHTDDDIVNAMESHNELEDLIADKRYMKMLAGMGSYTLSRKWLLLNHFRAMIIKRFHYVTRNWKGLFSQIILPALFVSIAMTVALSAPKEEDLPPLELSPSQYFNVTQPKGNYIPYSNEHSSERASKYLYDSGPEDLIKTFHLPSGVGATCVLKTPFNGSLDEDIFRNMNVSDHTLQLLEKYYERGCERVFVPGIQLENYVPQAAIISDNDPTKVMPTVDTQGEKYYPNCECKTDKSSFECSETAQRPPEYRVVTRDIMQDITTKKINNDLKEMGQFYLYTTDAYRLHRYGAFSFGTERAFVPEDFGKNSPTAFRQLAVRGTALAWYNNKGYHSMPVYLNALNNAILRANLPKSKGHAAAYGITVTNHPMIQTNNILNRDYILQGADVLIAIFIIAAMSFVPASFVVFLVYERSIKAKHLQFVSGLNPVIYWLANYVWDMCNYVIPAICIIVILLAFQIPAYVSSTNFPAVISLFLLYGWSMAPMMYPASFFFKEPSAAYIFLIVINLFTGITCIVCSFLLEIFSYDKALERIHTTMKDVFLIFPNYCLGRGLMDIAFNQYENEIYFKTGQYDMMLSPLRWDLITKKLVIMSVMGLVFFVITILIEYRFFIKPRQCKFVQNTVEDEDVDVAAERKRILRGSGMKDLLRLENLTKVYKTRKLGHHLAVDKLCIGVPEGECFGLLGVNGAGKTTTFRMLTGDLQPTSGDAHLHRYSITKDLLKVQQNIGYCPQFDALFDELTAKEHIQLYSRLRGVPPSEEKNVVEWALQKLVLSPYENRLSGTYSGGNKRKLSTAIALIGHPPLIFMDEPTTGMDPHSRRFLWDLILELIHDGCSVILTSHSMEECEALCTRLAIMVNGKFKCLGSIQHLKNKYGNGYTVSLRLKGPDYDKVCKQAQRFIQQNFPKAIVKECHYNLLQFELKGQELSLSYVFSKLEKALKYLHMEDYSITQNNLDNVFINFVKQQMEIVQESGEFELSHRGQTYRSRTLMSNSSLMAYQDEEELLLAHNEAESNLEAEDDDVPILSFSERGTHLSLLSMDPVIN